MWLFRRQSGEAEIATEAARLRSLGEPDFDPFSQILTPFSQILTPFQIFTPFLRFLPLFWTIPPFTFLLVSNRFNFNF